MNDIKKASKTGAPTLSKTTKQQNDLELTWSSDSDEGEHRNGLVSGIFMI